MRMFAGTLSLALLIGFGTAVQSATFSLNMDGSQETGAGDPDGTAFGTLTLDPGGAVSWNFSYTDIVVPTAMHIHGPGGSPGNSAGPWITLDVSTTGGAGTLISSLMSDAATVGAVLSNPNDFYVNIHNADFGGGAVRGQVPEPSSFVLAALGMIVFGRRRSWKRR